MSILSDDQKNWERVKNAKPGDPVCYVNLDAIEALPDQFQATLGVVDFNKAADFTNVGSDKYPNWYPGTRLMYDIANKRGISSCGEIEVEAIYETVDISLMELAPNPCPMQKKTGYIVKKTGFVVQEDGTSQTVQEAGIDNAWDEAVKLWTKEELACDGYTKTVEDKYKRKGYNAEWNGALTFKEYKYDTKYKRRSHFQDLFDKSFGMATTTAWLKVIRRLAGLKTGYTDAELSEGKFYFAKITKSTGAIKAEAAARLTALSHGIENNGASRALFGPSEPAAPEPRNVTPPPGYAPPPTPSPETLAAQDAAPVDQREELIRVLKVYDSMKLVDATNKETFDKMSAWLEVTADAATSPFWIKAIGVLTDIELAVPDAMRISGAIKR